MKFKLGIKAFKFLIYFIYKEGNLLTDLTKKSPILKIATY